MVNIRIPWFVLVDAVVAADDEGVTRYHAVLPKSCGVHCEGLRWLVQLFFRLQWSYTAEMGEEAKDGVLERQC